MGLRQPRIYVDCRGFAGKYQSGNVYLHCLPMCISFFFIDRFTWSHTSRTKPLDSLKLSSAMWTKHCEELSRVFLSISQSFVSCCLLICPAFQEICCGSKRGGNPYQHHQHHGGLTLVSGRDVGGVGVDSCLLLNFFVLSNDIHNYPSTC